MNDLFNVNNPFSTVEDERGKLVDDVETGSFIESIDEEKEVPQISTPEQNDCPITPLTQSSSCVYPPETVEEQVMEETSSVIMETTQSNVPTASINEAPKSDRIYREDIQRRDNDNVKNYSLTLIDIDKVILDYIRDNIKPYIKRNGQRVNVPVIHSFPERWQTMNKNGFLRDEKGQLQCPLVLIHRTNVQEDDTYKHFNRELQATALNSYSKVNRYDKFSALNSFIPVKEQYNVVFPDWVTISYELRLWTDTLEQMNYLIETFLHESEEYWGIREKDKLKFYTTVDAFSDSIDLPADEDRIVRNETTITVKAPLLPEDVAGKLTTDKQLTTREVIFGTDATWSPDSGLSDDGDRRNVGAKVSEDKPNKNNLYPVHGVPLNSKFVK